LRIREERTVEALKTDWREIGLRKKNPNGNVEQPAVQSAHVLTADDFTSREHRLEISDEWTNASGMFRTASWGACQFIKLDPGLETYTNFLGKVFT
jgi:hypothetical protein